MEHVRYALLVLGLLLQACGIAPHLDDKAICLGKLIPIVTDLTITPSYEPCLWTDTRDHLVQDTISCQRELVNGVGVTKVKSDTYERYTFPSTGVSFLEKSSLTILYFSSPNQPSCVSTYFQQDVIDDQDYMPQSKYCTVTTEIKCVRRSTGGL